MTPLVSSSSLSLPPEIQTKSTFEPEYPEVSKDVHESFIPPLPEPTLSESSNESDSSDSSVDHSEYSAVGGLGKSKFTEESREYPDVHKGAQVYTDHPVLERKRSFSPSSESSIESVPKQPLRVSISRSKIDGQTSYTVQLSPPPAPKSAATHLSPTGVSEPRTAATSPGLQISSSSYQKVRSIRPAPVELDSRLRLPATAFLTIFSLKKIALGIVTLTPSSLMGLGVKQNFPERRFRRKNETINEVGGGSNLGVVTLAVVMETVRLGRAEGAGRIDRTFW